MTVYHLDYCRSAVVFVTQALLLTQSIQKTFSNLRHQMKTLLCFSTLFCVFFQHNVRAHSR